MSNPWLMCPNSLSSPSETTPDQHCCGQGLILSEQAALPQPVSREAGSFARIEAGSLASTEAGSFLSTETGSFARAAGGKVASTDAGSLARTEAGSFASTGAGRLASTATGSLASTASRLASRSAMAKFASGPGAEAVTCGPLNFQPHLDRFGT